MGDISATNRTTASSRAGWVMPRSVGGNRVRLGQHTASAGHDVVQAAQELEHLLQSFVDALFYHFDDNYAFPPYDPYPLLRTK